MLLRPALLIVLLAAGCSPEPAGPDAGAGSGVASGSPVFAREGFAPPPARDAGVGEPPVAATVDPAALDEILAAAAGRDAGAPAADPGRAHRDRTTRVALDGGAALDGGPAAAGGGRPGGRRSTWGKVVVEPGMSTPSIERAARAQIYWPLVQHCRDPEGAILPPEVVHLAFQIDRDGYIVPSTVVAVPKEPRFGDAARCMARELSMATFRAPAAARGLLQNVSTDVPSVD